MIKAIIFDFAGVIVEDGYWSWLAEVVPDLDIRRTKFLELSERVDSGSITHEQFLKELSEVTEVSKDEIWNEVSRFFILHEDVVALAKKLKHEYKMGLLSNFTAPWMHELLAKFNLNRLFNEMLISSEHGIIKPDPAAYQKILSMLKVKPEEAFFIDDRQYNIDAARALGIHATLFTGAGDIEVALQEAVKDS